LLFITPANVGWSKAERFMSMLFTVLQFEQAIACSFMCEPVSGGM